MDAESIHDINVLLRRCDEEQAAFEATHLTAAPKTEPKKVERVLTESDVNELIMKKVDMLASIIGGEVGALEKKLRAELVAEVGALRAEIVVSSTGDKGIVDLGKWRNDAA